MINLQLGILPHLSFMRIMSVKSCKFSSISLWNLQRNPLTVRESNIVSNSLSQSTMTHSAVYSVH